MKKTRRFAPGPWLGVGLLVFVPVRAASAASAQGPAVVAAPVGGEAIAVGARRVVCPGEQELNGWRVEANGRKLRPPAKGEPTRALVRVAESPAACANQNEPLVAQAVVGWPKVAADSLILNVDTGRLDVSGLTLKDVALNWRVGERAGVDVCRDALALAPPAPQDLAHLPAQSVPPAPATDDAWAGRQHCGYAVPRDLPADAALISLIFLPENVPVGPDTQLYDALGRRLAQEKFSFAPAKVLLQDMFAANATLDAEAEEARISWRHPEAIGQVSCLDALCELQGTELAVRGLRGSDDTLEARVTLRPHVFLRGQNGALLASPMVDLPLQRCPLAMASSPPLRSVGSQRVVLRVGGRCAEDSNLRYLLGGQSAYVIDQLSTTDGRFVVLQAESSLGEDVTISLQRRTRVVAQLRVKTRQIPALHARIDLPEHGEIDFLPTNRDAEVLLPPLGDGALLVPVAVPGVYTVTQDGSSRPKIRGLAGTTGWVALRFAYRDSALPGPLAQLNLASFSDTVDRSIHAASLPISLGDVEHTDEPLIELLCALDGNPNKALRPAQVRNLAYRDKDSCRLVLHRERLRPENGDQLVRITVQVAAMDGTNRPEAGMDQRVLFRPHAEPRYFYIGGVTSPFDKVVVRAQVVTEDLRDAVVMDKEGERLKLPQLQWSLIVGNSRIRLYATMAMPTGLYRVAEPDHSGIVGLSGGILARMVWLSREGVQAPIGLEIGTLVMGITGDTTPAPHGNFTFVGGLSLGVPIANVSKSTQAAISLHAWAEYEITRKYKAGAGRPWGFIFGPSLSFGDVGLNL